MGDARDGERPGERQHRARRLIGGGVVNAGMIGMIEDEPDIGIAGLGHDRVADTEEDRLALAGGKRKMHSQPLGVAGFDTVIDDSQVVVILADAADGPGLPAERPGEGRPDARIDRLVVGMGVRVEIDYSQGPLPKASGAAIARHAPACPQDQTPVLSTPFDRVRATTTRLRTAPGATPGRPSLAGSAAAAGLTIHYRGLIFGPKLICRLQKSRLSSV